MMIPTIEQEIELGLLREKNEMLIQAVEKLEQMRVESEDFKACDTLLKLLAREKFKSERYEEALKFYAKSEHWMQVHETAQSSKLLIANQGDGVDGWSVAREALSQPTASRRRSDEH